MSMSQSKTDRVVFEIGEAYAELKDRPDFQKFMMLFDVVIESLSKEVFVSEPDGQAGYKDVMVHRAGKIKGLMDFRELLEMYYQRYVSDVSKKGE